MHLCFLNKEFVGLGYDFYQPLTSNHGVYTYKLYRCRKCGRLIYKNKNFFEITFRHSFEEKVDDLKKIGYKTLIELLK